MNYDKMKPIPTTYKGVEFRSRLEARWAAFFDQMRWPWIFEPIDLDGWFPDFLLRTRMPPNVLVEVKPFTTLREFEDAGVCEKIAKAMNSCNRDEEVLLLGLAPFWEKSEVFGGGLKLGWLQENYADFSQDFSATGWDLAPLTYTERPEFEADFCHEWNSYTRRVSGWHHESWDCHSPRDFQAKVDGCWAEATNLSAYKARPH